MQNNSVGYSNQYGVDRFIKFGKLHGLQYNPAVPIEHINKRPVYSYGNSFDPLSLSPALWLDANDSSTITTVSGAVSEWRDKSGNNRHATQETAGNRPLLVTGGLNNRDTIHFNTHFLNLPSISNANANYTLFLIARPLLSSSLEYYLDNSSPRLTIANRSNASPSNTLAISYLNTWNASNILSSYNTNQIICYRLSANVEISRNGETFWAGASYTPQTLNGVIRLGITHNSVSANPYRGYLSEFIIFPNGLSNDQVNLVNGYLAHKWGLTANLPTNHPYKNTILTAESSVVNLSNWSVNSARPKARARYDYTL